MKKLHGIVTDFSLRPKWIFGLKSIRDETEHLNTIGSKHLCILHVNSMEFEITAQHIEEGMIEYVEQSNTIKWLAPLNQVFILKRLTSDTSSITIHVHYRKNWLSKIYLDFPLRWMIKMMLMISFFKLKGYISRLPT